MFLSFSEEFCEHKAVRGGVSASMDGIKYNQLKLLLREKDKYELNLESDTGVQG